MVAEKKITPKEPGTAAARSGAKAATRVQKVQKQQKIQRIQKQQKIQRIQKQQRVMKRGKH
jgi:hypothetical protein